jgi:phosphate transport system permease protein
MPIFWLIIAVLVVAAVGYVIGRSRALTDGQGDMRNLHSLPSYYGWNVAMKSMVPGFLLMIVWLIAQPMIIGASVSGSLPQSAIAEGRHSIW